LFNIAPKRANWDLKREMEKKLAKLERKTQEAIHTLIRQYYHYGTLSFQLTIFIGQRLAAQKGQSDDLVGAMKADAQAESSSDEED
jgi:coiled-coil domain-containing protein 12